MATYNTDTDNTGNHTQQKHNEENITEYKTTSMTTPTDRLCNTKSRHNYWKLNNTKEATKKLPA